MLAFDTETTGIDPHAAELVGLAVAWGADTAQAAYIPLKHFDLEGLPWEAVRATLQPVFARRDAKIVAHNASYDLALLNRYGLRVAGDLVDTMIAAWLIDPGSHGLGLKDQVWTRLKIEMTPITELIGSGKSRSPWIRCPPPGGAYAGADAAMTLRLAEVLLPELETKGLTSLFHDIEMPLVPVLVAMEAAGIKLDVPFLQQMSVELTARLHELEREIQEIAGFAFNINSTSSSPTCCSASWACPARA